MRRVVEALLVGQDPGEPPPPPPAADPPPRRSAPASVPAAPRRGSVAEAVDLKAVAEARLKQLQVQAEARKQLKEDGALIPAALLSGMAADLAGELRRMVDRMRRRVETLSVQAGGMVEDEWMATAPRLNALLHRVEPGSRGVEEA